MVIIWTKQKTLHHFIFDGRSATCGPPTIHSFEVRNRVGFTFSKFR